jgi:hypothetical protein
MDRPLTVRPISGDYEQGYQHQTFSIGKGSYHTVIAIS